MESFLTFLQGKKTYIVALTVAILAGLHALNIVVPDYIMQLLGALGLATVRDAINTSTKP